MPEIKCTSVICLEQSPSVNTVNVLGPNIEDTGENQTFRMNIYPLTLTHGVPNEKEVWQRRQNLKGKVDSYKIQSK